MAPAGHPEVLVETHRVSAHRSPGVSWACSLQLLAATDHRAPLTPSLLDAGWQMQTDALRSQVFRDDRCHMPTTQSPLAQCCTARPHSVTLLPPHLASKCL